MANTTSLTSTTAMLPDVKIDIPLWASLKIAPLPVCQDPAPKITPGFTITASKPSCVARHTSISAAYLVRLYTLFAAS